MKRSVLVATALLAAALVAGASVGTYIWISNDDPAPVDQALGSGPPTTFAGDPTVTAGCTAIKQATSPIGATSNDPTAMEAVANQVATSTNVDLAVEAKFLLARATIARAATGARDEGVTRIELQTAALRLATACIKAGY
jgi:hypothetical protein